MFGNNGVMFGMDGPNMEGTWYNPQTGDSFTVRNSFFEDSQYIVQTTDGRILNYNQIQNYVKSDKPIEMPKPELKKSNDLPAEVANLLADDYSDLESEAMDLIAPKPLGNLAQPTPHPVNTYAPQKSMDLMVIEKALNKCSLPNLQVGIEWDNFPTTEAKFLVNVMDVTVNDIIAYYLDKVDVAATTAMIHEVLKSHIEAQLLEPEKEIVLTEESKPSEPVAPKVEEPKKDSAPKKMGGPKASKATKPAKTKKSKVNE